MGPDMVLLQEAGLAQLTERDYNAQNEARHFSPDSFSHKVGEVYPTLLPLLEEYQIVNASPLLFVRRGSKVITADNGLILDKKSLLQKYEFVPLTRASCESNAGLMALYKANQGKPIVGIGVRDVNGHQIMNIFGVHFEKARTVQNLKSLVRIVPELDTSATSPT